MKSKIITMETEEFESRIERKIAEGEDLLSMCRTCLERRATATIDSDSIEILQQLTELQTSTTELLPLGLCYECLSFLRDVRVFGERCRRSDALLRRLCTIKSEPIKCEPSEEDFKTFAEAPSQLESDSDSENEPLKKYSIKAATKTKALVCSACDRRFARADALANHRRRGACEKRLASAERKSRVAAGQKPFACSGCGGGFAQRRSLVAHRERNACADATAAAELRARRAAGDRPFGCDACPARFAKRFRLKAHAQMHAQTPHACALCDRRFSFACSLKRHGALVHGVGAARRRHVCERCGKAVTTLRSLRRHMVGHAHPGAHKCSRCDATFARRAELTRHAAAEHADFVCDNCGLRFVKKNSLRRHVLRHVGLPARAFDRPVKCPLCDARFKCNFDMMTHLPRHERRQSYTCALCPVRFLRRAEVAKHERAAHGGVVVESSNGAPREAQVDV